VPIVTVITGVLLIGLGAVGYLLTEAPTSLIPAGFGVFLVVLGALANREKLRMHAMHGAVLIGLLGLIGALVRVVPAALSGEIALPRAFAMQVVMAVICAIYVALCVKSFIDARRRRKAAG
jgi:hypothetical protein